MNNFLNVNSNFHFNSGGPIQVAHNDAICVFDIIGVTSFGPPVCGLKVPAVYARVAFFLDWIERMVWPNEKK